MRKYLTRFASNFVKTLLFALGIATTIAAVSVWISVLYLVLGGLVFWCLAVLVLIVTMTIEYTSCQLREEKMNASANTRAEHVGTADKELKL